MSKLENRTSKNLNQKKLKVVEVKRNEEGEIKEIIVDIEKNDNSTCEGTKVQATELTEKLEKIVEEKMEE